MVFCARIPQGIQYGPTSLGTGDFEGADPGRSIKSQDRSYSLWMLVLLPSYIDGGGGSVLLNALMLKYVEVVRES